MLWPAESEKANFLAGDAEFIQAENLKFLCQHGIYRIFCARIPSAVKMEQKVDIEYRDLKKVVRCKYYMYCTYHVSDIF